MKLGISLILVGFACVFIGAMLNNADVGGVIMIGPVPIAFGTSPGITIIAMGMALLLMLVYFMLWRRHD